MYRFAYIAYGLFVASAGVTFVFLEDIETQFGISALGIGAISGMSFLMSLVVALGMSPLGDRGHVVELAVLAFITAAIGNIWLGLGSSFWEFFIARGLASFGIGLFGIAARKALIGSSVDGSAEKLGGLISAAVAGFLLGPSMGAWLEQFGGMLTPYLVLTVALVLCAPPSLLWLRRTPIATSSITTSRAMLPLLRIAPMRAAVATHTAVFLNIGVFDSTVDELLTDLGASNTEVAIILIIVASPLLVVPTIAGRFVDQHPRPQRILLLGHLLFVPILLSLSFTASILYFVVFAFVQTAMESVVFPSAARVTVNQTGAEESAIGQGLLDSAGQLAAAVSAFIAPVMYDLTNGPLGSFGMSGSIALLLLIYAWTQVRDTYSRDATALAPDPI